jgi:hypothetical protein
MAYSYHRAGYEAALAAAHRALHSAAGHASDMGSEGEQHDTEQLMREVTRLGEDSLRGKARRDRLAPLQSPLRP